MNTGPGALTDHQLEELADKHAFMVHERDSYEQAIQDLKIQIGTEMAIRGVERVDLKKYSTLVVTTERKTLNQNKLLEAGVTQEVIASCMDYSESSSVRVNPRRTGDESETEAPKPKKSHHKKKPETVVPALAPVAPKSTSTIEASGPASGAAVTPEQHAEIIDQINPLGQD